jgi:large subunit ribosomal protein L31
MKTAIHPTYFVSAKVTCACGNAFVTGSAKEQLHTEVCSNCHPFFTGKQKLLDTAGRVDKFKTKQTKAASIKATTVAKKPRKTRAAK